MDKSVWCKTSPLRLPTSGDRDLLVFAGRDCSRRLLVRRFFAMMRAGPSLWGANVMHCRGLPLLIVLVTSFSGLAQAADDLPQFATRRFGTARFAHSDRIMDVGLSRDGKRFVTLGMSGARVFDRDGKLLQ